MIDRIVALHHAVNTSHGWHEFVDNGNINTKWQASFIYNIQKRLNIFGHHCLFYTMTGEILKQMTWIQCCNKAVETMRECEDCEVRIDNDIEYTKTI